MLCPICRVLMSDVLIHLKGCAKTVPLHTTLPANPRYWLGADSKATPVGLCTTQSQVISHQSKEKETDRQCHYCHPLPFIHACDLPWFISIPVAHFLFLVLFFWPTTTLFLVYSSGHSFSVFLFHMDTKVGREGRVGGGCWMGLSDCLLSHPARKVP